MTTPPALAVTGSTGALGRLVADHLSAAGVPMRLLVRNVAKAPELPGATVFPISYSDREASEAALAGAETLFMVSASESATRLDEHRAFVDSAAAAGVRHIVYTSFAAAAPDAVFTLARDHYATEEHIKASGMHWTFLRDNFYLDFMPFLVGDDGVIRGPAGDGVCSIVARSDIARAASTVLADVAAHRNVTYDMTGPEAVSMAEIAETLTAHGGTEVKYHAETIVEAYESRAKYEAPDWQVDAWVSTYTSFASGEVARVSADIEALTGTPPISLATYLAGH